MKWFKKQIKRFLYYLNIYSRNKDYNKAHEDLIIFADQTRGLTDKSELKDIKKYKNDLIKRENKTDLKLEALGKSFILWAFIYMIIQLLIIWGINHGNSNYGKSINLEYYAATSQIFIIILIAIYMTERTSSKNNKKAKIFIFGINLFGVITIILGEFFSLLALAQGKSTGFTFMGTNTQLMASATLLILAIYERN